MSGHEALDDGRINDIYNEGLRAVKLGRWRQARENFLLFLEDITSFPQATPENSLHAASQLLQIGKFFCKILCYQGAVRSYETAFTLLCKCKEDLELWQPHTVLNTNCVNDFPCKLSKEAKVEHGTNGSLSELVHMNNSLTEMRIEDTEIVNALERSMAEVFKHEVNCMLHMQTVDDLAIMAGDRLLHFREDVKDAVVCATLGGILLEVGQIQVDNYRVSSAKDSLETAMNYFRLAGIKWVDTDSPPIAKLLGNLGYCYMCTNDQAGSPYLKRANVIWQRLGWPVEEVSSLLNALKHTVEMELKNTKDPDDREACSSMMKLYVKLKPVHQNLRVAEAFVHLGAAAFQNNREKQAVGYFEQALWMYKQSASMETNRTEIVKVLRFIGISSYNCRNFQKAAKAYTECLAILKSTDDMNTTKLNQLAECYASLGFTFSRLRDFDQMLHFYELALELQRNLAAEDLELIQTNVGSLYFVKAVKAEQSGDVKAANTFFQKAEASFNRAQRYSWKSFPFINFGYYLLCRGRHTEAVQILSQGYHNGQVDKDTVEFDHTEDPILIEDLQFELEEREDIRMPSAILALYLQTLAHTRMVDIGTARRCVAQLHREITSCKYEAYYVEGFGVDRMKALCYSLLGYAYRHLDCHSQALEAFSSAVHLLPSYTAANRNVESQRSFLASRSPERSVNVFNS